MRLALFSFQEEVKAAAAKTEIAIASAAPQRSRDILLDEIDELLACISLSTIVGFSLLTVSYKGETYETQTNIFILQNRKEKKKKAKQSANVENYLCARARARAYMRVGRCLSRYH